MFTFWVLLTIAVVGLVIGLVGMKFGFIKKAPSSMTRKGAAQGAAAGASTVIHGPGSGGVGGGGAN